jgi:putative tryptophan/tyrosine transport system substrate-binding protein
MNPKCRSLLYIAVAQVVMFIGLPVYAQTPRHTPQIGLLSWSPCYLPRYLDGRGQFGELLRGLTELGYKLGETLLVTCRDADSHYDRLVAATDELVRLPVDVIGSASQPVGAYANQATKSVPIVTIISGDPVAAGLARSLAHPGGNVTGVSYYATELTAKRLELLKQMRPTMTNVGILANPDMAELPFEEDARKAALALGIKTSVQPAREPTDLENAIARMKADGAEAIFVLPDLMLGDQAARIAELAMTARLPTMGWGLVHPIWMPDVILGRLC